jgi:hypothetical protein
MSPTVLAAFGIQQDSARIDPFGSGLINHTWKITADKEYILQKINQVVFKEPENIAHNIRLVGDHLKNRHPDYLFVEPIRSKTGEELVHCKDDGYYRLFPFVAGSHTINVVETPEQAFEAARQFGRFTRMLADFDAAKLKITIPFFHDLDFRYRELRLALDQGNSDRIEASKEMIEKALSYSSIVAHFCSMRTNPAFKMREPITMPRSAMSCSTKRKKAFVSLTWTQ